MRSDHLSKHLKRHNKEQHHEQQNQIKRNCNNSNDIILPAVNNTDITNNHSNVNIINSIVSQKSVPFLVNNVHRIDNNSASSCSSNDSLSSGNNSDSNLSSYASLYVPSSVVNNANNTIRNSCANTVVNLFPYNNNNALTTALF